ncbi:MAG: rhamnulokinase [Lachnospiraceae bacterium]|nr:rhamnulokinase [Lachnospiraceae bacterium]
MKYQNVIAFDLGASSGRGIMGEFDGEKLSLSEVHRFVHNFSLVNNHAYWDTLYLFDSMKEALQKAPGEISSIGFDTWGVDIALIDKQGNPVGFPMSYRDSALNDDNMNEALAEIAKACKVGDELVNVALAGDAASAGANSGSNADLTALGEKIAFNKTGIASLAYNTLYKLYYLKKVMPYQLENADKMLFMPNFFEYLFSGEVHNEYSIASTSECYDMFNYCWNKDIINALGFPERIFTNVDFAGKNLGNIRADIAEFTGKKSVNVISVSGHDTACACAAVPATEENFTFLSSGTWSLIGISSKKPLTGDNIIRDKISNEGTYDGGYRPTVNIIGLWIIQELRRNFKSEGKDYSFAEMAEMAEKVGVSASFIIPDDFMLAGNYPEKIRNYCKETGQKVPENDAELVSCVLTSLALRYRQVYETFKPYITWEEKLYIVGGGVNNKVLCQFTANSLGIPVITGAGEATAVGNVMQQLKAIGEFNTAEEKCDILAKSFETNVYEPRDREAWDEAYTKFLKLQG